MTRQSPTRRYLCVLGFASTLAIAGCGSEAGNSAPEEPEAAQTSLPSTLPPKIGAPAAASNAVPGAASFSPTPHPEGCVVGQLRVSLGTIGGAAGSREVPLVFTNVGTRNCVLDGFPGVSYTSGAGGTQIGATATRTGDPTGPVGLMPGATAIAMVRATDVQNYPPDVCDPTPVAGFRVYPPNDFNSVFVPYATTGCARTGDDVHQLSVQAVTG